MPIFFPFCARALDSFCLVGLLEVGGVMYGVSVDGSEKERKGRKRKGKERERGMPPLGKPVI